MAKAMPGLCIAENFITSLKRFLNEMMYVLSIYRHPSGSLQQLARNKKM
jgi:hypothetical protein